MRVSELSQLLDAVLEGDGSREVQGVAALDTAGPGDVAFAEGERGLARLRMAFPMGTVPVTRISPFRRSPSAYPGVGLHAGWTRAGDGIP